MNTKEYFKVSMMFEKGCEELTNNDFNKDDSKLKESYDYLKSILRAKRYLQNIDKQTPWGSLRATDQDILNYRDFLPLADDDMISNLQDKVKTLEMILSSNGEVDDSIKISTRKYLLDVSLLYFNVVEPSCSY